MMSYIPIWVLCIPDRTNENYYEYLLNQATRDGMPDHVRKELIRKYFTNPPHLEDKNSGNVN